MYNDWFSIGSLTIHGYGVMVAVGILAAVWLAEKLSKRFDLDAERVDNMIFFILVCGFACSKLISCLTVLDELIKDPLSVLGSGGWVVYGGIIGGILGAWGWCRHHGWDFMRYLNILIVTVPLAQTFGRIGCFFAGCCYGIPWEHGILYYSQEIPASEIVRRFPVQLLESALVFALFLVLYFVFYRRSDKSSEKQISRTDRFRGHLVELYLGIYAVIRFLDEFLRGDVIRGHLGPFSTSQWIALVTLIVLAIIQIRRRKKKPQAQ